MFDISVAKDAIGLLTGPIKQVSLSLVPSNKLRLRRALSAIYFTPTGSVEALKKAVQTGRTPDQLDNRRRDFLEATHDVESSLVTIESFCKKSSETVSVRMRTNLNSVRYGKIEARAIMRELFQFPGADLTASEIERAVGVIALIEELNSAILQVDDKF